MRLGARETRCLESVFSAKYECVSVALEHLSIDGTFRPLVLFHIASSKLNTIVINILKMFSGEPNRVSFTIP